jgi:hypothetical protein
MPDQKQDRAAKANAALWRKFLEEAGGDRELADQLRSEYYRDLQSRSAATRRANKAAKIAAELAALRARGVEISTFDEVLRAAQELVKR